MGDDRQWKSISRSVFQKQPIGESDLKKLKSEMEIYRQFHLPIQSRNSGKDFMKLKKQFPKNYQQNSLQPNISKAFFIITPLIVTARILWKKWPSLAVIKGINTWAFLIIVKPQLCWKLSIERVIAQQEEIAILNTKLAPFRIFSGIESDILADGSLDYPDEILSRFDFIVASVHSGLRMDSEKANNTTTQSRT